MKAPQRLLRSPEGTQFRSLHVYLHRIDALNPEIPKCFVDRTATHGHLLRLLAHIRMGKRRGARVMPGRGIVELQGCFPVGAGDWNDSHVGRMVGGDICAQRLQGSGVRLERDDPAALTHSHGAFEGEIPDVGADIQHNVAFAEAAGQSLPNVGLPPVPETRQNVIRNHVGGIEQHIDAGLQPNPHGLKDADARQERGQPSDQALGALERDKPVPSRFSAKKCSKQPYLPSPVGAGWAPGGGDLRHIPNHGSTAYTRRAG